MFGLPVRREPVPTRGRRADPAGRSSRTYVHNRPVFVRPRPGFKTGTGVSSVCTLPGCRTYCQRPQPVAGSGWRRTWPNRRASSGAPPRHGGGRWPTGGTSVNDRILGDQHLREQRRRGQAALDRPRPRRQLDDLGAVAARELRAHCAARAGAREPNRAVRPHLRPGGAYRGRMPGSCSLQAHE